MPGFKKKYILIQTGNWKFLLRPSIAEASFAEFCSVPRSTCPKGMTPVVSSVNTEVRKFVYKGKGYFLKEYFFANWKKHLKVLRRGQRLVHIADLMAGEGFLTPRIVGIGRTPDNDRRNFRKGLTQKLIGEIRDLLFIISRGFIVRKIDILTQRGHPLRMTSLVVDLYK